MQSYLPQRMYYTMDQHGNYLEISFRITHVPYVDVILIPLFLVKHMRYIIFFKPESRSKPTSTHWIFFAGIFPATRLPTYPPMIDPAQMGTAELTIKLPAL